MEIAKDVLKITKSFPETERYGLISQINRSAISIPSNIAEGSSRKSDKEFSHFLSIALGSCFELETQLILSADNGYLSNTSLLAFEARIQELQKMIYVFNKKIIEFKRV